MDQFIEDLLAKMTLAEKAGQMTQLTIDTIANGKAYKLDFPLKLNEDKLIEVVQEYAVGSMLNVGPLAHSPERWREIMDAIASRVAKTRLKIPILYGIDSIHGASYVMGATLFPQQLGLAASWNRDLARKMGEISAYETKAAGMPWAFSPVLDLGRNPVWPRIWETFGEDVYLAGELGSATVRGMQGDDIGHPHKLAACLKHFLGYGVPLSGRDRTPAYVPARQLAEYHVPPFAKALAAGAATVMINSGEMNGIPVHSDPAILTDLLRDELGFTGLVVTDWEDIQYLHSRHRVAETQKEAVRLAIEAGIDMSMVPLDFTFTDYLIELVEEGTIPESRLDLSVRRILQLKKDLGLFKGMVEPEDQYPLFAGAEFKEASLEASREAFVLCKNEEANLPLQEAQKVLLCGPAADTLRSLNGGWTYSWQGELTDEQSLPYATVRGALQAQLGDRLKYEKAVSFSGEMDIAAAVKAAKDVDVIVTCLGESSYTEFYGNIDDLRLDQAQIDLVKALATTGKPIILVLLEGRPRLITEIAELCQAILVGFHPGNEGGQAVAEILTGKTCPSGKLPITYPKYPNALSTYDYKHPENLELQGVLGGFKPQFEFGHGLSYTTFSYSNLRLSQSSIHENDTIRVSVEVENTGKVKGKEVVQLYLSDLYASITPPVKRLKRFEKIELEAGASKTVNFDLTKDDLAFVGRENRWIVEPGTFKLRISSLSAEFVLQKTSKLASA
ncbi:MAG: glycoside hydrolase family 3 C-terminal domain-containing protein [Saprospiraceae bacterium]|nr:glycoside hydrolase family 3 C-terminal domain-containing protein [Saprospiraceae bacterium]